MSGSRGSGVTCCKTQLSILLLMPAPGRLGVSTPLLHSAVDADGMLPDSRSSKRQCLQLEFRRQLTLPDGSPVEFISHGRLSNSTLR